MGNCLLKRYVGYHSSRKDQGNRMISGALGTVTDLVSGKAVAPDDFPFVSPSLGLNETSPGFGDSGQPLKAPGIIAALILGPVTVLLLVSYATWRLVLRPRRRKQQAANNSENKEDESSSQVGLGETEIAERDAAVGVQQDRRSTHSERGTTHPRIPVENTENPRTAMTTPLTPLAQEPPRAYRDYTVAVVCAKEIEMSAVRAMLDSEHVDLNAQQGDTNAYTLGSLCGHKVILVCLPGEQGKGLAAGVATDLSRTFLNVKWWFLVGIAGGVYSNKHDIRLGDVVISWLEETHSGVVQYDLGRDTDDGFYPKGHLHPAPLQLKSTVEKMRSNHRMKNNNNIDDFVGLMLEKCPSLADYGRPSAESDVLFLDDYHHRVKDAPCTECDQSQTVKRPQRQPERSKIHYGLIASGDSVIRSATTRNKLVRRLGDVLCFEMEAAGLLSKFPCIVIRGISDYADSHKNDSWQKFAAAAAAACAKELLSRLDPGVVPHMPESNRSAARATPDGPATHSAAAHSTATSSRMPTHPPPSSLPPCPLSPQPSPPLSSLPPSPLSPQPPPPGKQPRLSGGAPPLRPPPSGPSWPL